MVARTLQALPAAVGAEYGNLGTWGRGSMGMLWAGLGPVKQVWIYEHPMHPHTSVYAPPPPPHTHGTGIPGSPALWCRVRSSTHDVSEPSDTSGSRVTL